VIFSGTLSFLNNKTGNVRGIRRGGKETYRTILRLPVPSKEPLARIPSNYRLTKRNNRKASIVTQIDHINTHFYSIIYSPEIYIIPPDMVIHTEPYKSTTPKRSSAGPERSFLISPRSGFTSPRIDDPDSKLRKRFNVPSEKPPEMNNNKMQSKSSFIPANKLKHPFRQVTSRFWGSQRTGRQNPKAGATVAAKPKAAQPSLKQFLDGFNQEEPGQPHTPVNRRKIRSRSVPNLEALIAMADHDPEEGKWGLVSARSNNGGTTTRARFGEYRSQFRNNVV